MATCEVWNNGLFMGYIDQVDVPSNVNDGTLIAAVKAHNEANGRSWRSELRWAFNRFRGGAKAVIQAIDSGKFDGGFCNTCFYGCIAQSLGRETYEMLSSVRTERLGNTHSMTPLELFVWGVAANPERRMTEVVSKDLNKETLEALRAECVLWLAENGHAAEPALATRVAVVALNVVALVATATFLFTSS